MEAKTQVHPCSHTASHGSYMQHTTPKRKCKERDTKYCQSVCQSNKKSLAADIPRRAYFISNFLMQCQLEEVSFNHLRMLSLIEHQAKL